MMYNWQQADWPNFSYDTRSVEDALFAFYEKAGRISGLVDGLSDDVKQDAIIDMMVSEATKTSEIEGEYLSRIDVMSSIKCNLGIWDNSKQAKDKRAVGVGALMTDVRERFSKPMSEALLLEWHSLLMQGQKNIAIGAWRDHSESMQVVSGPIGKQKVHFEAPPSDQVPNQIKGFVEWFNATAPDGKTPIRKAPIRSALAHLYFETIHPFEDGNGRIGRAISEKTLSQNLGHPVLLSLSRTIEANKKDYYEALKTAQRSNEVTPWIEYFVEVCVQAQIETERHIEFTLEKALFFDRFRDSLNERQSRVINRMLDAGLDGFEGGMSTKKYIAITHTSKATATRDLQELANMGAMHPTGGGRSTRYVLPFTNQGEK